MTVPRRILTPLEIAPILQEEMEKPKIVTLSLPEYTIDEQPDYETLGRKIDKVVEKNFEGIFLERVLSVTDHPQYTLDQLADIIIRTGTDKYDPDRKGVCHDEFAPYHADLQASSIEIHKGKLSEPFGADLIKHFYENVLLDRGYRLRTDLILLYDPQQMVQAEKVDAYKPGVQPHLEQYLWRFKDTQHKAKALAGVVKILR